MIEDNESDVDSTVNPLQSECESDLGTELGTEIETPILNGDSSKNKRDPPKTVDELRSAYLRAFEYEFMVSASEWQSFTCDMFYY